MGTVVLYGGERDARHAQESCAELAREIAALKRYEFDGRFEPSKRYSSRVYFVPSGTLALATARAVGIESDDDLFGGVVPDAFVATKVITHPLVSERAFAPASWSAGFARAVSSAVLVGYTAFSRRDARVAGARLLEHGPVRVKEAHGTAGRGQCVCRDRCEVSEAVEAFDEEALAERGVVLEQDLVGVETFSVGQVRIDDLMTSYVGTQRVTRDNAGHEVYGGTSLLLARGDYGALLGLELDVGAVAREAIGKARLYESAAYAAYSGFFASRRNYDVACGRDRSGRECCGVLEQSWRVGGASGAELAGLRMFRGEPELVGVRASSYEIYGPGAVPPAHAKVYFHGEDEMLGPMLKYVVVDSYVGR